MILVVHASVAIDIVPIAKPLVDLNVRASSCIENTHWLAITIDGLQTLHRSMFVHGQLGQLNARHFFLCNKGLVNKR